MPGSSMGLSLECAACIDGRWLMLLGRQWLHSEMWWPRLFAAPRSAIAWDDYEKDYSDLPRRASVPSHTCPPEAAPHACNFSTWHCALGSGLHTVRHSSEAALLLSDTLVCTSNTLQLIRQGEGLCRLGVQ